MDVSGRERSEMRSMTRAGVVTVAPSEHEQSFGGWDLLSLICPELGVAPLVDPGTDCEDELPTRLVRQRLLINRWTGSCKRCS